MFKLMFLGINGSLQEEGSGNTSILISGSKGCAAVDLSCNLYAVVNADIDAVIFTHEHIDHVYALPSLLHQLWLSGRTKKLDIYLPQGMNSLVNAMLDLFGIRDKKNIYEINFINDGDFNVGTMHFRTFKTDHTKTSVGIVVEDGSDKIIYTSDTRPINTVEAYMDGAQLLIHEASGLSINEETLINKGHSSGFDAGSLACRLKVSKLYICHLPKGEKAKSEILKEAEIAFKDAYIPKVLEEIYIGA